MITINELEAALKELTPNGIQLTRIYPDGKNILIFRDYIMHQISSGRSMTFALKKPLKT